MVKTDVKNQMNKYLRIERVFDIRVRWGKDGSCWRPREYCGAMSFAL
jgi:hypothetical protein